MIISFSASVLGDTNSEYTDPKTGEITKKRYLQIFQDGDKNVLKLKVPHDFPVLKKGEVHQFTDINMNMYEFNGKVGFSLSVPLDKKTLKK